MAEFKSSHERLLLTVGRILRAHLKEAFIPDRIHADLDLEALNEALSWFEPRAVKPINEQEPTATEGGR